MKCCKQYGQINQSLARMNENLHDWIQIKPKQKAPLQETWHSNNFSNQIKRKASMNVRAQHYLLCQAAKSCFTEHSHDLPTFNQNFSN